MTNRFVLLRRWQMTLIVLLSAATRVQKEFGELNVGITLTLAFHVIHESAEAHQRLLHLLMAIEPFFLTGTDVRHPAVGKFLGRLVEPQVFPVGKRVMVDGRFDEVSGNVAFVIAALSR